MLDSLKIPWTRWQLKETRICRLLACTTIHILIYWDHQLSRKWSEVEMMSLFSKRICFNSKGNMATCRDVDRLFLQNNTTSSLQLVTEMIDEVHRHQQQSQEDYCLQGDDGMGMNKTQAIQMSLIWKLSWGQRCPSKRGSTPSTSNSLSYWRFSKSPTMYCLALCWNMCDWWRTFTAISLSLCLSSTLRYKSARRSRWYPCNCSRSCFNLPSAWAL